MVDPYSQPMYAPGYVGSSVRTLQRTAGTEIDQFISIHPMVIMEDHDPEVAPALAPTPVTIGTTVGHGRDLRACLA